MDFIYSVLSLIIGGGFMLLGLFIVAMPFMVIAALFKIRFTGKGNKEGLTKDDIVNAQWEYDRKWRRRD